MVEEDFSVEVIVDALIEREGGYASTRDLADRLRRAERIGQRDEDLSFAH